MAAQTNRHSDKSVCLKKQRASTENWWSCASLVYNQYNKKWELTVSMFQQLSRLRRVGYAYANPYFVNVLYAIFKYTTYNGDF